MISSTPGSPSDQQRKNRMMKRCVHREGIKEFANTAEASSKRVCSVISALPAERKKTINSCLLENTTGAAKKD